MYRKITEKLLEWKEVIKGKTALLIDGARRIGKTYVVEEFAKTEYKSFIKVDFSLVGKELKSIFENDSANLNDFFNKLQVLYNVKLYERNSLIIFDEVQLYPKARQLVKSLVADGRYDYIETGSLISLKRNVKDILIPSEEEHINMYPMDFEEFLIAVGESTLYRYLKDKFDDFEPVGQAIHKKTLNLFRQYMIVGGMPMSVQSYVKNGNFEESEIVKKSILTLYREDIEKNLESNEMKARTIFDLIPNQLQRKEKKIKYSDIDQKARTRDYNSALKFLEESKMINICNGVTDPSIAMELSIDGKNKKCYMGDIGLLVSMTLEGSPYINNEVYKKILFDKLYINEGMYAENIVAQELRSTGHKLYYYKKYDNINRKNNIEIDFLISGNNGISVIEVKSSSYKQHTSLDKFRKKFGKKIDNSYILYDKDIKELDGVKHLPIYMAAFL